MKTVILSFLYSMDNRQKLGEYLETVFPEKNKSLDLCVVGNYAYHSSIKASLGGKDNGLFYIGHTNNFTRRFLEHNGIRDKKNAKGNKWKQIKGELEKDKSIFISLIVGVENMVGAYSYFYDYEEEKAKVEGYDNLNLSEKEDHWKALDLVVKTEQSFLVEGALLRTFNEFVSKKFKSKYSDYLWNENLASRKTLKFLNNHSPAPRMSINTLSSIVSARNKQTSSGPHFFIQDWDKLSKEEFETKIERLIF